MKSHTTVTITRRMLADLHACPEGLYNIRHLLPMKVSTDVEENLDLACELADSPRAVFGHHCDTVWLLYQLDHTQVTHGNFVPKLAGENPFCDAWVVAQHLAAIADIIATKKGK